MELDKNIEAIVLDLDGTIFHLNVDWSKLKTEIQDLVGRSDLSYDDILKLAQKPKYDQIARLIEKAEIEGVTTGSETKDAATAISRIKTRYRIAVVTRNARASAAQALHKLNIAGGIDIVGREDVKMLKPHPEALELAIKLMKVERENTIMVGDTYHDIQSAHQAGIRCIVVSNFKNEYTPKGGDYYVSNLLELSEILMKGESSGRQ